MCDFLKFLTATAVQFIWTSPRPGLLLTTETDGSQYVTGLPEVGE